MPARIVRAARGWLGTPYHDQASVKGVGCDCLGLIRGVWREVVGPEPKPVRASVMAISIIAAHAASASTSRGPASPQSRE